MAKQVTIQGNGEIQTDTIGLTATLHVRVGSEGPVWDADAVVAALKAEGIDEGYSPEDIAKKLASATVSKDAPLEIVVAKGAPPEDATPEIPQWASFPVPEELSQVAQKVVGAAEAPVIQIEKTIKEKKEKQVEKRSPIPFVKPKIETVTVVETTTVTERVYIDPTVTGTGFAEAGAKIATVQAATTGSPGRSLHGDVLQPRQPADPSVYAGPNTERSGETITATASGFIRYGTNWVDVVPFANHQWSIELSEDRATCYLNFTPGHPEAAIPTFAQIVEHVQAEGFPVDQLMPEADVARQIADAVGTRRALVREPLCSDEDGFYDVTVSEDRLRAVLNLRKGRGNGTPLSLKEVGAAIRTAGLKGIDTDRVKQDVLAFFRGPELELIGYELLLGRDAKAGLPRTVDCSVRFAADDELKAFRKENEERPPSASLYPSLSSFPVSAVDAIATVEAEQRLYTIGPPTTGKAGVDVYGEAIPGLPGPSPVFRLHENLEQKQNVIIARVKGLLERREADGEIDLRIRPTRRADVRVTIADDKMSASVSVDLPEGSAPPVGADDIRAALAGDGVTYGLDDKAIEAVAQRIISGASVDSAVVAKGRAPRGGASAPIRFLIDGAEFPGGEPGGTSGETADDRSSQDGPGGNGRTIAVKANQPIAVLGGPSADPQPARDVTGAEIALPPGDSGTPDLGAHVSLRKQPDGTKAVVADVEGELLLGDGRISVRPVRTIRGDVDRTTGNVKFPGVVQVGGFVRTGCYVMSEAEVKILGGVEGALVSADDNILVRGGIKGNGKAVLRSKKNIGAAFIERSTVLSVGDVKVKNTILQCRVKCNGLVTLTGETSAIVGGTILTRRGLRTQNLGSQRGITTHVSFGQDYLVADQIELEEKEIRKLQEQVAEVDAKMKRPEMMSDKEAMQGLFHQKGILMKRLEKRGMRLFTLRERFEHHFPSEIVVRGTIYPGVVIESHGRTLEVSQPKRNLRIHFDTEAGHLVEAPLEGVSR